MLYLGVNSLDNTWNGNTEDYLPKLLPNLFGDSNIHLIDSTRLRLV